MKKKNWTNKIYRHFSSQLPNLTEITTDTTSNHSRDLLLPNEIQFRDDQKDAVVCIEGPFSTCTSYIFDCEHVVLIGAGIGITPYISALENLIYQLREQRCICFQCGTKNYNQEKLTSRKLKKIDFIWVNRDIGNFSWFHNILDEFEAEQDAYLNATTTNPQEQRSRYLDIHLYCTSIRSNEQAMLANLPYNLIANMYEVMQHQDMHTQLRTPTHVGRPPWKLLFAKFKAEHRSTNVFFTGNKIMGDEIKKHCNEHTFTFQHEPYF
jgi:predicted ferric reductase